MIACPNCGADTKVTETREGVAYARRRRRCVSTQCGLRFTTGEVIVPDARHGSQSDLVLVRRAWIEELAALVRTVSPTTGEEP